jgi:hypothetical protein
MLDIYQRAKRAYFHQTVQGNGHLLQPSGDPDLVEYGGRKYLVLSNSSHVLAVYQIVMRHGEESLKGLRQWPVAINNAYQLSEA